MRLLSFLILLISLTPIALSSKYEARIEQSLRYLSSNNIDSSFLLAKSVLSEASDDGDSFGLVKSNFILGYIHHLKRSEYGKAIIYYLEAIRFAEESNSEIFIEDLISIYKNSGVIFRKFKSFDLAEEYYLKGIEKAMFSNNQKEEISLRYNLAIVYKDQDMIKKSIQTLENLLPITKVNSKKYFDILNSLGLRYNDLREKDKSLHFLNQLISELPDENLKMMGYAYHNIATTYLSFQEIDKSIFFFQKAILAKSKLEKNIETVLFSSYHDIGTAYQQSGNLRTSQSYFLEAEKLIPALKLKPEFFQLYKSQADLYYKLANYERAKHYDNLYAKNLNDYLDEQAKIQESEQRFNMDLITKRYFAEVDKQDRIAEIMFASQLTSGGLLTLLLLVIGYHRYQKIMLRRSIERELVALKIIE